MDPLFGMGSMGNISANTAQGRETSAINTAKAANNGARSGVREISQGLGRAANQTRRVGQRASVAAGLAAPPGRRISTGAAPRPAYNKRGAKGTVRNVLNYSKNLLPELSKEITGAIMADARASTSKTRAEVERLTNKLAKVHDITIVQAEGIVEQMREAADDGRDAMEIIINRFTGLDLTGFENNAETELPGSVHQGGRRSYNKKTKRHRIAKKHRKTRRH